MKTKNKKEALPWMELSAAIVSSGVKENDEAFLNSDWCKYLIEAVENFANESIRSKEGLYKFIK